MASARDIRRRIKGVKGTGKITRAMEMISAVKMRKAVATVLSIRPYAESAIALLFQLKRAVGNEGHILLTERPVKRELYVVISSNRGLCGAFNAQIVKHLRQTLKDDADRERVFLTIGKKGENAVRRMLATPGKWGGIIASFPDVLSTPTILDMRAIAKIIIEEFEMKRVDRVVMVYTDYISMLSQEVKVRALLPVAIKDTKKAMHEMGGKQEEGVSINAEYIIEPTPKKVLWQMIPRLLEMELYHAVLESNASQESSRMMAMRNATDAAKDMVSDLTLAYNQLRQGKITQEIAELSAGMAAVQK
ncbi:MAG: ATP synthase F1 subunit gamma [Candidatus Moranbacteria bacterium]|nr:ATP synthase F1 subunit gamma [Candidatus Moranbacteria bacterium]OIQ03723.1 MAG: ATP synthase F1 subunit gamma [Candidatus Moranbacteria bacterium CG2_30_41_165]PIP25579.1 MAG: ATP synthase F1 subunit gamma [Candidatus Moranbacteria bacterium CG23_combo_of_CG06-09_8_20_14_all_41_28]PIV85922.1 MAG: ATP synthase F1 subunit gamma [Candidatus Moranbacteria bacterium CG17_big_fil_post_rev_8_21_14_2_50_41_107]PIW94564.1 MAG: ATP synthase F1 subunit gamma [Candidatus Moranbacteria bacterium CG_4_8